MGLGSRDSGLGCGFWMCRVGGSGRILVRFSDLGLSFIVEVYVCGCGIGGAFEVDLGSRSSEGFPAQPSEMTMRNL